jgi:hypothetical protein
METGGISDGRLNAAAAAQRERLQQISTGEPLEWIKAIAAMLPALLLRWSPLTRQDPPVHALPAISPWTYFFLPPHPLAVRELYGQR